MIMNNYNEYILDEEVKQNAINNFIGIITYCIELGSSIKKKNIEMLKGYSTNKQINKKNIKYIIKDYFELAKEYELTFESKFISHSIDLLCLISNQEIIDILIELSKELNLIN